MSNVDDLEMEGKTKKRTVKGKRNWFRLWVELRWEQWQFIWRTREKKSKSCKELQFNDVVVHKCYVAPSLSLLLLRRENSKANAHELAATRVSFLCFSTSNGRRVVTCNWIYICFILRRTLSTLWHPKIIAVKLLTSWSAAFSNQWLAYCTIHPRSLT